MSCWNLPVFGSKHNSNQNTGGGLGSSARGGLPPLGKLGGTSSEPGIGASIDASTRRAAAECGEFGLGGADDSRARPTAPRVHRSTEKRREQQRTGRPESSGIRDIRCRLYVTTKGTKRGAHKRSVGFLGSLKGDGVWRDRRGKENSVDVGAT